MRAGVSLNGFLFFSALLATWLWLCAVVHLIAGGRYSLAMIGVMLFIGASGFSYAQWDASSYFSTRPYEDIHPGTIGGMIAVILALVAIPGLLLGRALQGKLSSGRAILLLAALLISFSITTIV